MYEPCFIHPTRRWSRLAGNIQIPDCAVSPHLRPAHRLPESLAWSRRHRQRIRNLRVEGRCDHTIPCFAWYLCLVASQEVNLQPVPGTKPAGRKFTPASTSETGRKSSAGLETPPLTLLVPVEPLYPNRVRPRIAQDSNWWNLCTGKRPPVPPELRARCIGEACACATSAIRQACNSRP